MSKLLNTLYKRANKKGVAIAKNYTDWYGDKLDEPEEKYRIEIYDNNGVRTTNLYHYETLTLSVEEQNGKYTIKALYGESISDSRSIADVLSLVVGSQYCPIGLTYREARGGFGLVDSKCKHYMQEDYKNNDDFIAKANELLKA